MIQPLIQQLTASNPQLAQLINQNPEAFYQLLAGDDEEGEFEEGDFGGMGGGAGQTVIQLTEQEAEAVRRVSLGRPFGILIASMLINSGAFYSSNLSDSTDNPSSGPTCCVTRTKNWPPTFCSTTPTLTDRMRVG